jgi:hypothetical protein
MEPATHRETDTDAPIHRPDPMEPGDPMEGSALLDETTLMTDRILEGSL